MSIMFEDLYHSMKNKIQYSAPRVFINKPTGVGRHVRHKYVQENNNNNNINRN